jgi:IS1 family transposase
MVGVDKKTVLRLLANVGDACEAYHDQTVRNLSCVRVQLDEIWAFCYAKERNLKPHLRGEDGFGDVWTWTAIDADTKLVVSWHMGKRTRRDAHAFIRDLSHRISSYVQLSTDGFYRYKEPIQRYFGIRADHGTEVKEYGYDDKDEPERKYSPLVVKRVVRRQVFGAPDPAHISTAYVERSNLTMRMSMRRFTRLTNAFSKRVYNMQRAVALNFMYYNFCRRHQSLRTTPAIAHGLTDRVWTLHDLAALPDLMRGEAAA